MARSNWAYYAGTHDIALLMLLLWYVIVWARHDMTNEFEKKKKIKNMPRGRAEVVGKAYRWDKMYIILCR
jgi:hypothetical protein